MYKTITDIIVYYIKDIYYSNYIISLYPVVILIIYIYYTCALGYNALYYSVYIYSTHTFMTWHIILYIYILIILYYRIY